MLAHDEPTAAAQMAYDQASALAGLQMFRVFRWSRPAISLGWKQPRPAWMATPAFGASDIEVVERPTGGGVALHGSDLSCSAVVSYEPGARLHEVMDRIAGAVAAGLGQVGVPVQWLGEVPASRRVIYCLAETSSYALMSQGRKLCGFALRRFPGRLLVQGSLLVSEMPAAIRRALPEETRRAYRAQAITLEEAAGHALEPEAVRRALLDGWRSSSGFEAVVVSAAAVLSHAV